LGIDDLDVLRRRLGGEVLHFQPWTVGDVLAVGAWKDDIDANLDQGSIYLFRQIGGQWIETGIITASDGMGGDEFGYSLAAQGNRMVTGAHKADFIDQNGGAAYVLLLKP
jgi:hypothetical protein